MFTNALAFHVLPSDVGATIKGCPCGPLNESIDESNKYNSNKGFSDKPFYIYMENTSKIHYQTKEPLRRTQSNEKFCYISVMDFSRILSIEP